MKITIDFFSTWAIGSGKGGDSKDSIILKDDNDLPFIPGKTLKGLIRDAFLECGFDEADAIRLFGQKKVTKDDENIELEEGALRFNSAHLPDDYKLSKELKSYLYSTKTSTRLEEGKQAKEHSLRKNEVCIPLSLTSTILIKEDNTELEDDDYDKIEKALKMLKILGEKRHRGLGRCKITADKFVPNTETKTSDKTITKDSIRFKCEVTAPLVLVKKAKTGQNIESLDYMPGNTFRGIVAGAIAGGNKAAFNDIIFNNTVQFGDAHLVIDSKRSLKTPFSFFYDKSVDDSTLYNFHLLNEDGSDWIDKKLKSSKNGYLVETVEGFKIEKIKYGNRIKSSRSYKNRSSENSGMFSYHYIKKGQEFEFEVNSKNTEYLKQITKILNGKTKYFGKSKSAEFGGAIKISYIDEKDKAFINTKGNYLYAESNLCFLNKYGEFTATPTPEQLGVTSGAEIDWEKSQVKFRTFAPYNFHRKNWDFERLIIEKGSVFVFKNEVIFDDNKLNKGLGCFLTEGYGKVLIDPSFLAKKEVPLMTKDKEKPKETDKTPKKITVDGEGVIKLIQEKFNTNIELLQIEDSIGKSLNFKQKNSSQWARVFNATTRAKNLKHLEYILWNADYDERTSTRNQSIFTGGTNTWEESDITTIKTFLDEHTDNEILALRKLAKKMISITSKTKKNELSA